MPRIGSLSSRGLSGIGNIAPIIIPTGPALGSSYQGGYYLGTINYDDGRIFRLIVSLKSTETSLQWSTLSTNSLFFDNQDGFANNQQITSSSYPAGQYAWNLTTGGYTDWYLPSVAEWNTIKDNATALPGGATFTNAFHLTSQASGNFAWQVNPITSTSGFTNLTATGLRVRAIRRELVA